MKISIRKATILLSAISLLTVGALSILIFSQMRERYENASAKLAFETAAAGYSAVIRDDLILGSKTSAMQKLAIIYNGSNLKADCAILRDSNNQEIGAVGPCAQDNLREAKSVDVTIPFVEGDVEGYHLSLTYGKSTVPVIEIPFEVKVCISILVIISSAVVLLIGYIASETFATVNATLQGSPSTDFWKSFSEIRALIQLLHRKDQLEQENRHLELNTAKAYATSDLATQVAHDIRSPLSALSIGIGLLDEIPEEKRDLIRKAASRINDIANGLIKQSKMIRQETPCIETFAAVVSNKSAPIEPTMLVSILDYILSEKRMEFRSNANIELLGDLNCGYGIFVNVDPTELSCAISNLLNNSFEAIAHKGKISVSLRKVDDYVHIFIEDSGKGIPAAIIDRIGTRQFTFGKEDLSSGTGLGVYSTKNIIEKYNGSTTITSTENVGTLITIKLPCCPMPAWFCSELRISTASEIVSLDDEQTIHTVWSDKIRSLNSVRHLPFVSPTRFSEKVFGQELQNSVYLIDQEFNGWQVSGLEIIEDLGLQQNSILVTSRWEERSIREKAEQLSIRIIPKNFVEFVPIIVE